MKTLVIISLVFLSFNLFATDNDKIKAVKQTTMHGTITDKSTGETLAGVAVSIPGLNKTVYTDFYGNFKVEGIVPGNYQVKVSYISYKEDIISDVKIDGNNGNNVSVQMEPKK
ncbi:MAG: hypothetical protein A2275_05310 [Bacteroidetes bacterium RIFOXYA12_FULL_35_11]|nr:MAG: hypothetical protein A2X01_08160 [Bacteroidetes bacterium GWF2_35_48]OFY74166.1 MAG: hypothetical protein A2275_05310 [Bacteroidetes bacterium RIFOXYA12_FULL_35_11]OFY93987.1 MAG: hypothetical protein A2491_03565 [Bacteroidetes bacterium RIFOXYC12_FULL_35_7]OFY94120.1 MAG: hypothetical protein A2309_05075 [Bacteroidetes bacterium RIFOXYB2_FULL_35_7]HBX51132.1 hypothetical protein [Bacteroidales bacterium]